MGGSDENDSESDLLAREKRGGLEQRGQRRSDLGREKDVEPRTVEGRVAAEIARFEERAPEAGERIRGEIIGLIGEMLGLGVEEQEQLQGEEGQRRLQEGFERFEQELRRAMSAGGGRVQPPLMPGQVPPGVDPNSYPFFSDN